MSSDTLRGEKRQQYGYHPICAWCGKDNPHWWVQPDVVEQVDSFSGLEPLPITEDLVILPFEKYGLWWTIEFRNEIYVWTHGPYSNMQPAIEVGIQLTTEE